MKKHPKNSSNTDEVKEKHEWHQKKRRQQKKVFEEVEEFGLDELKNHEMGNESPKG